MLVQFLGMAAIIFVMLSMQKVLSLRDFDQMVEHLQKAAPLSLMLAAILVFGRVNYTVALFVAGFLFVGVMSLRGFDVGVKSLFTELTVLFILIGWISYANGGSGGLLSGAGLSRTAAHAENLFAGWGYPILRNHVGMFTLGGISGLLLFLPGRIYLKAYLQMRRARPRPMRTLQEGMNDAATEKGVHRARSKAPQRRKQKASALQARIARVSGG